MARLADITIKIEDIEAFQELVQRLNRAERELASLREYLDMHNDRLCRHDERITRVERANEGGATP